MFELRIEWEDAPGVAIPAFRETWARLEFRRDGRPMTRFWSEQTRSLRDGVYVSVFPLARWIAHNWWLILGEGLRNSAAIDSGARRNDSIHRSWLRRHNLLACREGMAYPNLTLFREDDHVAMIWSADPDGTTIDGRFVDGGSARASLEQMEAAFERLMCSVIERVAGIDDEEVDELRAAWDAIRSSQVDERELCRRMGILGIDPYDPDLTDDLTSELSRIDLAPAVVRDLLAATEPGTIKDDLATATHLLQELPPASSTPPRAVEPLPRATGAAPYRAGHSRAAALRHQLGLSGNEPVGDLPGLASGLFPHFSESWVDDGALGVEAAVQANGAAALAARKRQPTAGRFLLARALHHWLYVMTPGAPQRLLTRSGDWQQAASRAFAAELLAPARALHARLKGATDWELEAELAEEFDVSPMVIAHQIENHGLG